MSVPLRILPRQLPPFVRGRILAALSQATADAFGCPAPSYGQLSYDERLRTYALFTREQADGVLRTGRDVATIRTRLFQNACPLGRKARRWLGVDTMGEVMALGQILYRAIGVEMQGDLRGDVTVTRCYFSQFYSGPVCDLISALDDGLFSGLSGGGRLRFTERLTDGGDCCRARLRSGQERQE